MALVTAGNVELEKRVLGNPLQKKGMGRCHVNEADRRSWIGFWFERPRAHEEMRRMTGTIGVIGAFAVGDRGAGQWFGSGLAAVPKGRRRVLVPGDGGCPCASPLPSPVQSPVKVNRRCRACPNSFLASASLPKQPRTPSVGLLPPFLTVQHSSLPNCTSRRIQGYRIFNPPNPNRENQQRRKRDTDSGTRSASSQPPSADSRSTSNPRILEPPLSLAGEHSSLRGMSSVLASASSMVVSVLTKLAPVPK